MGAFTRLKYPGSCLNCGRSTELWVQFKYGYLWHEEYEVGDSIQWQFEHPQKPAWKFEYLGNNGRPGLKRVVADGIMECCPVCHGPAVEVENEDVYVIIERDVITGLESSTGQYAFEDAPFEVIEE